MSLAFFLFFIGILGALIVAMAVITSDICMIRQFIKAGKYIYVRVFGDRTQVHPIIFKANPTPDSIHSTWNPLPSCCLELNPHCWNNCCWPNPTGLPSRLWSYPPTPQLHVLAWLPHTEDDGVSSAFFADYDTARDVYHLTSQLRWAYLHNQSYGTISPIEMESDSGANAKQDNITDHATITNLDSPVKAIAPINTAPTTTPVRTTTPVLSITIPAPVTLDVNAIDEPIRLERTPRMKGRSRTERIVKTRTRENAVVVKPECIEREDKGIEQQEIIPRLITWVALDVPAFGVPSIHITHPTPVLAQDEVIAEVPAQTDLLSPILLPQHGQETTQPTSEEQDAPIIKEQLVHPFPIVEIPSNRLIVRPLRAIVAAPEQVAQPIDQEAIIQAPSQVAQSNHDEPTVPIVPEPVHPVKAIPRRQLLTIHSSTSSIESLGPITPPHNVTSFSTSEQPTIYYPAVPFPTLTDVTSITHAGHEDETDAMDIDPDYAFTPKMTHETVWGDAMEIDSDIEYSSDSSNDVEMEDLSFSSNSSNDSFESLSSLAMAPYHGLPFRRPTTFDLHQDVRMVSDPMSIDEDFVAPQAQAQTWDDQEQRAAFWSTPMELPSNLPPLPLVPFTEARPTIEDHPVPTAPIAEHCSAFLPQITFQPGSIFPIQPTVASTPAPAYVPTPPQTAPGPISEFERMLVEEVPLNNNITTRPPAYTPLPAPAPVVKPLTTSHSAPRSVRRAAVERDQRPNMALLMTPAVPVPSSIPSTVPTIMPPPALISVAGPVASDTMPAPIQVSVPTPTKRKETETHIAPAGLDLRVLGGAKYNSALPLFAPGKGKKLCTAKSTNLEEAVLNGSATIPEKKFVSASTRAQVEKRRKERQAVAGEKARNEADKKYAGMFHNTSSSNYHKS